MDERFVLRDVVRCREVDLEHVLQPVSLGRGEDDAGSKPPRNLEPSKCIFQCVESGADGRYRVSAQSTMKSATT